VKSESWCRLRRAHNWFGEVVANNTTFQANLHLRTCEPFRPVWYFFFFLLGFLSNPLPPPPPTPNIFVGTYLLPLKQLACPVSVNCLGKQLARTPFGDKNVNTDTSQPEVASTSYNPNVVVPLVQVVLTPDPLSSLHASVSSNFNTPDPPPFPTPNGTHIVDSTISDLPPPPDMTELSWLREPVLGPDTPEPAQAMQSSRTQGTVTI
jgi:hypothetical protein